MMAVDVSASLLERLRCPATGSALCQDAGSLVSNDGRRYPIVHGVPVLLLDEPDPTLWVASASYRDARANPDDPYQIETLGISDHELSLLRLQLSQPDWEVDPIIGMLVGATCGYLYKGLIGKLPRYPIPELRLASGTGDLLDVGCNWGRWCIAAAKKGYRVTGVDPSLGAVLAARRLANSLGHEVDFVVADARRLPFKGDAFDLVFSYSVLQHLEYAESIKCLKEIRRVLRHGGRSLIQMPNKFGVRCLQHQWRRRFRPPREFEVRYWSPVQLAKAFSTNIGPSRLSVDGFFGLGIQPSDAPILPLKMRAVVRASEAMRTAAAILPPLKFMADSFYVESTKAPIEGNQR